MRFDDKVASNLGRGLNLKKNFKRPKCRFR